MRLTLTAALVTVAASPAFAASGPFFSLGNTDFVVLLAFLFCALTMKAVGRAAKGMVEEVRDLADEADVLVSVFGAEA